MDAVTAKRACWLTFLSSNRGIGRKEARLKSLAVHSWLQRNDWQWLQSNLPARKLRNPNTKRVDWLARDKQIAVQVAEVGQQWKSLPGKPRRVTVTAIGHELGISALLSKHIHKLPRTRIMLDEFLETDLQFASRRILCASQRFIAQSELPTFSDLMHSAGIGAHTRKVAGVESALRDCIEMIHQKVDSAVILRLPA
ncbi:MAG TPA: TnsD family Tn7-like transposition protein [Verrucomicrobiae bacterium]|nr:TnsD family Tn7-like transposition protein [Verrucomicrobiae bacterium]